MFGQLLPNKNKITIVPGTLFMPEFGHLNTAWAVAAITLNITDPEPKYHIL
jgi:hypothetical protein